jgi:hypothetical protein
MPYSPRTFENKTGVEFDADKVKVVFAEDMNYMMPRATFAGEVQQQQGILLGDGSSQSISSGSDTVVEFQTILTDNAEMWDEDAFAFVIPKDGIYRISAQVTWESFLGAAQRILYLKKNGDVMLQNTEKLAATEEKSQSIDALYLLTQGDIIQLTCKQESGGSRDLITDNNKNIFTISRVGN